LGCEHDKSVVVSQIHQRAGTPLPGLGSRCGEEQEGCTVEVTSNPASILSKLLDDRAIPFVPVGHLSTISY
jgi:hypothetical protein